MNSDHEWLAVYAKGFTEGYEAGTAAALRYRDDREAIEAANHFRDLWEDARHAAANLFFLAEHLWSTCPERRDTKSFINVMAYVEHNIPNIEEYRSRCLAGALKTDFNPKIALGEQFAVRRRDLRSSRPT